MAIAPLAYLDRGIGSLRLAVDTRAASHFAGRMLMANRRSIEERIAQLEAQKKALQARLAKESRARDTRRKVLLGAFLMHRMEADIEQGDRLRAWLSRELPEFLTRETDRELFEDLIALDDPAERAPSLARSLDHEPSL